MKSTNKKLEFEISFDDSMYPNDIKWLSNSDMPHDIDLKSLFIAGWEKDNPTTASLQLWTTDFRKDEMQQFFVQSVLTLAKAYEDGTGEKGMVDKLQDFFITQSEKNN